MNEIDYREGKQKLSGPASAYYTEYENKKYNFFGDVHESMAKSCDVDCKNIDMKTLEVNNPGTDCWEISGLLSDMFNKASRDKQFIDFYLEIPFLSKEKHIPSREDIYKDYKKSGYIPKLEYIFYKCFFKLGCQYDYVRFHYVDLRHEFRPFNSPDDLKPKNIRVHDTFQGFITDDYLKAANEVLSKKIYENDTKSSGIIQFTNILLNGFYFNPKEETRNFQLFKLYLTSDNFVQDALQLMSPLLRIIDHEKMEKIVTDRLINPIMIVKRKGKIMHKIRAQLEALESEGRTDLVEKIIEFSFNKFKKSSFNAELFRFWKSYVDIYEKLIGGEIDNIFDRHIYVRELKDNYLDYEYESQSGRLATDALLMDVYTLARMFRTYPNTSHQNGNKVVIFAGGAHINLYNEFFLFLNASIIGFNPNLDVNLRFADRCLKVDIDLFL